MAFPVNSVLIGTGQQLMGGRTAIIQEKVGQFEVIIPQRPNVKLQIDRSTWHVKDIIGPYKGSVSTVPAYCYQNRQTDLIIALTNNIINRKCSWLTETLASIAMTVGSTLILMLKTGAIPPSDNNWKKYVLGSMLTGIGIVYTGFDKLSKGVNFKNVSEFILNVSLACAPSFTKTATAGELLVNYVTRKGAKKEVMHISSNFEGYVVTTMKTRPGQMFIGGKEIEPVYMASVQYTKYGQVEGTLRTAFGNNAKEIIKDHIRDEGIQTTHNLIVNNYDPTTDQYTSKYYKNVTEYLKTLQKD
jgi:hypothetical protein